MTERVYSQSGKSVEVPGADLPAATNTTPGMVRSIGDIPHIPASTVTDIATAQAAIQGLEATVNTLLQAMKDAGQMTEE